MESLANLPREILVQIFSGTSYSFLAINIWKCGDRLLQSKLETGILSIDLRDNVDPPASKWPSCLSRFQHLRTLRIEVEYGYLCASTSILQSHLLRLSPELEELAIFSCDRLFSFEGDAAACSASSSFGNLVKLELSKSAKFDWRHSHPFYALMTRNIRSLSLNRTRRASTIPTISRVRQDSLMPQDLDWPPHLEFVDFLLRPTSFPFPPSIRIAGAQIGPFADMTWASQQPSLHTLKLGYWTPYIASLCPPTVTTLQVAGFREFLQEYSDHLWVPSLPPMLRSLSVEHNGYSQLAMSAAPHLPRSLTELLGSWFIGGAEDQEAVMDLPNLKTLEVDEMFDENCFAHCPDSVTSISTYYQGSISYLPPNLTYLQLGFSSTLSAPLKTQFLQSLDISIPLAQCCHLPPSLTKLHLRTAELESSLKAGHYGLPLRIEHLINLKELNCFSCSTGDFAYLPHSLTSFEALTLIHYGIGEYVEAFSQLPRHLRVLRFRLQNSATVLPIACLMHLKALEELNMACKVNKDFGRELKAALPRLRYVRLHAEHSDQLTAIPSDFTIIESKEHSLIAVTSKGILVLPEDD